MSDSVSINVNSCSIGLCDGAWITTVESSRVQKSINLLAKWVLNRNNKMLTSRLIKLTTLITLEIAEIRWIFVSFCSWRWNSSYPLAVSPVYLQFFGGVSRRFVIDNWLPRQPGWSVSSCRYKTVEVLCDWLSLWNQATLITLLHPSIRLPRCDVCWQISNTWPDAPRRNRHRTKLLRQQSGPGSTLLVFMYSPLRSLCI